MGRGSFIVDHVWKTYKVREENKRLVVLRPENMGFLGNSMENTATHATNSFGNSGKSG